jgi:hypothetical protein
LDEAYDLVHTGAVSLDDIVWQASFDDASLTAEHSSWRTVQSAAAAAASKAGASVAEAGASGGISTLERKRIARGVCPALADDMALSQLSEVSGRSRV